jgi:hypothetical protein
MGRTNLSPACGKKLYNGCKENLGPQKILTYFNTHGSKCICCPSIANKLEGNKNSYQAREF